MLGSTVLDGPLGEAKHHALQHQDSMISVGN